MNKKKSSWQNDCLQRIKVLNIIRLRFASRGKKLAEKKGYYFNSFSMGNKLNSLSILGKKK